MKYFLIIFALLGACTSSPKNIEGFDEEKWKSDPNGCSGERLEMIESLMKVSNELKVLDQNELTELLGKPDRHELYKRSQKFFYYQISPDENCKTSDERNIYLSIRFNAMGLSKEVVIMNNPVDQSN